MKKNILFFCFFAIINFTSAQNFETLPVQLVYFQGTLLQNNQVLLQWGTATETNNFGYNVERSINNQGWEVLGFVQGNGNSFSPKDYMFIDSVITISGQYDYRLRQFDFDGTENVSEIVSVQIVTEIKDEIKQPDNFILYNNYPNPFNPSTTISFYNPKPQKIEVSLYNSNNQFVKNIKNDFFEAGNHKLKVDLSHYVSGVYLIFFKLNDKFYVQKINFIK